MRQQAQQAVQVLVYYREGWVAFERLLYERGYELRFHVVDASPESIGECVAEALYEGRVVARARGHDSIEAVLELAGELGVEC